MKPITLEWIAKAEDNWHGAHFFFSRRNREQFETICFYTHECVEKYLKARLVEAGLVIRKTSNLSLLLREVLQVEPSWVALRPQIRALKSYTWDITYPGRSATKAEAKQALQDCSEFRKTVRETFGLPAD